jgi:hypothetical protein
MTAWLPVKLTRHSDSWLRHHLLGNPQRAQRVRERRTPRTFRCNGLWQWGHRAVTTLMMKGPVSASGMTAKKSGQRNPMLSRKRAAQSARLRAESLMKSRCLRWMTRKMSNSKFRLITVSHLSGTRSGSPAGAPGAPGMN